MHLNALSIFKSREVDLMSVLMQRAPKSGAAAVSQSYKSPANRQDSLAPSLQIWLTKTAALWTERHRGAAKKHEQQSLCWRKAKRKAKPIDSKVMK